MHTRSSIRLIAIGFGIALFAAACVHRRGLDPQESIAAAARTEADTVYLEIENHNWSDVEIFINHDGRIDRFTQVTAAKNLTLPIPFRMIGETGDITLIVRRIGGTDRYTSPTVNVRTGTTVRFTIEDALVRSSVGVW